MAELVIGAFLSVAFEVLVKKIATGDVLEFFSKGKKKKNSKRLSMLKSTMDVLCAVCFKVENKRFKNPDVQLWLDGLLDAVDDAEDFFGDIKYDALRPKKVESSKARRKASELLSKHPFRSVDDERNNDLKNILERFEDLAKQIQTLGLEKYIVDDVRPSKPFRWEISLPDEPKIYGKEHDVDALMQLVKSDDAGSQTICVIPILGMSGVGKTTRAQTLFNDKEVTEMFQLKAWVYNSDKFDAVFVTKTILQQVTLGDTSNYRDLNLLQVNLMKKLVGKRFLIVLDNVGDDIHEWWTEVMKPFHSGAEGSKIIVTTTNEKVADSIRTVDTYHLRGLSNDECWKVFEKYASSVNPNIFSENPMLESIGREVAKKCNGLPLAAKVLGSLLGSTWDVESWEEVSKNNIWTLTDERSTILPAALEVSYYYLPSHLKRCFAYCSIFPRGYEFQRDEVVLLWMAANLVEQDDPYIRMEDIGGKYFDDLVSRSLFQLKAKTSSTSTYYFVMHELINDLARTVAGKYFCLLKGDVYSKLDKKTRHLGCVMELLCRDDKISRYDIEASHLRTFLSFGKIYGHCISKEVVHNLLPKLKWLTVLSFRYCRMTELSESIGALKYLCYLDLSYSDIVMLPKSVVQLYNLQTLKLEDCCELQALPDDMHHLINLRHLIISGCGLVNKMPSQMRRLTNLQTLTNFVVGKDTGAAEVEELAELPNLKGELSIQMLENVVNISEAGDEVKVLDKKKLEKLSLEWSANYVGDDPEGEGVLEMLSPHITLKQFRILRYPGTHFPNWIGNDSFCNIVDVRLEDCPHCSELPTFGHLPFLKNLHISGFDSVEKVGAEFYGNSYRERPFPSLETLSFNSMPSWWIWDSPSFERSRQTEPDATPYGKLKTLEISNCPKLIEELPYSLPSLTKLVIASLKRFGFSIDMDLYPNLKTLSIRDCERFKGLSQSFEGLASLSSIDIYHCLSFECFPRGRLIAPNLSHLAVTSCKRLEKLPVKMSSLSSLKTLEISGCHFLSFPEGGLPISLSKIEMSYHQLLRMREKLRSLPCLTCLSICAYDDDFSNHKLFPPGGLLPDTITSLKIKNFLELKSLDRNGLSQLTSLRTLEISNCPNLETLSEDAFPISLRSLDTLDCPLLKKNFHPNRRGIYKIGGVSQVSID